MKLRHLASKLIVTSADLVKQEDGEGTATPSNEGHFIGHASVFGNIDLDAEIIDAGAFADSLSESDGRVRLLQDHWRDASGRLGIAMASEDKKGLLLNPGIINLDKQIGREAFSDIQFSLVHKLPLEMSIGFRVITEKIVEEIMHLVKLSLREVSIVTFAANPEAQVEATLGLTQLCAGMKSLGEHGALSEGDVGRLRALLVAGFKLLPESDHEGVAGELAALVTREDPVELTDSIAALAATFRA